MTDALRKKDYPLGYIDPDGGQATETVDGRYVGFFESSKRTDMPFDMDEIRSRSHQREGSPDVHCRNREI